MVDGHVVGWRVAGGAWLVPAGGEFTRETAHDGRLSAKVVNTNGGYLLFRQQVSIVLTAGARYRLSAWVRGKSLVRGADPWRTGSLRVAFTTKDGMRYAEVAALLGDFEWKLVSGIVEVPEGATRATVDVGVNGGTGTMWIDDVKLEPA